MIVRTDAIGTLEPVAGNGRTNCCMHGLVRPLGAIAGLFTLFCAGTGASMAATVDSFTGTLDGRTNLYRYDWGHDFDQVQNVYFDQNEGTFYTDEEVYENPEPYAIGAGIGPSAVAYQGAAFDFSVWAFLRFSATGEVIDASRTQATGPEGQDWPFRGLDAYSIIGIWSLSPFEIVPLTSGTGTLLGAFQLGARALVEVPDLAAPVYLFLGENDGLFFDNSGSYEVSFASAPVPVPVPWLPLGCALAVIGSLGSRRR